MTAIGQAQEASLVGDGRRTYVRWAERLFAVRCSLFAACCCMQLRAAAAASVAGAVATLQFVPCLKIGAEGRGQSSALLMDRYCFPASQPRHQLTSWSCCLPPDVRSLAVALALAPPPAARRRCSHRRWSYLSLIRLPSFFNVAYA